MSIVKKQHRADSLLSSLLSRFVFMVTRAGGGRVSLWWTMTCFNMTQHHTYTMWLCSRLENDRFEHRTSDIGNIGLQAAHRTSDCYTAPIPIRRSTSLGGPACQFCLFAHAYCSTVERSTVWSRRARCAFDLRARYLICQTSAVCQMTAWVRRGR